jgi:hypothetical protein
MAQFNLARIREEMRSDKAEVRGRASQELLLQIERDKSIHAEALQLFRSIATVVDDPWTALNCVRGIEFIAGDKEARPVRLELFKHKRPSLVAGVVLTIKDSSYVKDLIALLATRKEEEIHVAVVRELGRLGGDAALAAIISQLEDKAIRPHAVEALGELRDRRAIPHLEKLMNDKTPAWEEDNHGPMLHVSDLVKEALQRMGGGK